MPVWVLVLVDCFYIHSNISTGDSRGIPTTFHLTGVSINLQPSTSLIMKLIWFPCTCSWLLNVQEIFHISAALILFSLKNWTLLVSLLSSLLKGGGQYWIMAIIEDILIWYLYDILLYVFHASTLKSAPRLKPQVWDTCARNNINMKVEKVCVKISDYIKKNRITIFHPLTVRPSPPCGRWWIRC